MFIFLCLVYCSPNFYTELYIRNEKNSGMRNLSQGWHKKKETRLAIIGTQCIRKAYGAAMLCPRRKIFCSAEETKRAQ